MLPKTLRPSPLPQWSPDGQLIAQAILGASGVQGEHLNVADFESKPDNNSTFFVTVSEPSCFPLHTAYLGHGGPAHGPEFYDFFDAQEGISDPQIWYIPKECEHL